VLVLVEGVDGAGKTTFARALADAVRDAGEQVVAGFKRHVPDRSPMEEYELDAQWYVPGAGTSAVYDRWHWSEEAYGPVLRDGSAFEPWAWWHVEAALQARGAVVAWLTAPTDALRARLSARGDDLVTAELLPRLQSMYDLVSGASALSQVRVDVEDEGLDAALGRVLIAAAAAEDDAVPLVRHETYVGPPRPGRLLLGERRLDGHVFQGAFASTSGQYLLRALYEAEGLDGTLGLANALEEDVEALWEDLGRPPTVALGRHARLVLEAAGVPHGAVPHPQYVRRFHHGQAETYARDIDAAAREGESRLGGYRELAAAWRRCVHGRGSASRCGPCEIETPGRRTWQEEERT
jgi:predicted kinase